MKQFFLLFLLFLLFVGVSTSAHAGKVYKWTDEKGQIHYSTFPPAEAETEKVRVPSSNTDSKEQHKSGSSKYRSYKKKDKRYRKSLEQRKEREKKRAAQAYERKYGAETRLKNLERDKRQNKARAERAHWERIQRIEQKKKAEKFKNQMDRYSKKVQGLEGDCKAAHGTDCTNPEYLKKWVKKKYEKKK